MHSLRPLKHLSSILSRLADPDHYLFSSSDLRGALPDQSAGAFKTLLSRVEKAGLLRRVCRGIYLYPAVDYPAGLLLYHAAALLRIDHFNYISLETALSDAGVISQLPFNGITLMSSGRSNLVECGEFGNIEFVHTQKTPDSLTEQLEYDARCHLWRASVPLALKDMRAARRNLDLVNWELADDAKERAKSALFENMKTKGLFWSYSSQMEYDPSKEPLLIETVLKYADMEDIQGIFTLFGKRRVREVWEKQVKTDSRFLKLNYFLARVFFGLNTEAADLKGLTNARADKLRLLAG